MANAKIPFKIPLIVLIILVIAVAFVHWLWQRQPKGLVPNQLTSPQSQNINSTGSAQTAVKITIEDNKIIAQKKFTLEGTTQPNSLIVIYSPQVSLVVKSDSSGNFKSDLELDDGLNLIGVSTLDSTLKEVAAKNLTYYVTTDTKNSIVYAGLVKNIFQDSVTLTTQTGEQTVKKTSSTTINIPTLPGVQAQPQDKDIRVGDYMVALGKNTDENSLSANTINILRDNKPQNDTHYAVVKILSDLSKNTFSAAQNGQDKIVKITADKNTSYVEGDKTADSKTALKNKTAVIIYHEDDKSNDIASLVYLLP